MTRVRSITCVACIFTALAIPARAQTFVSLGPTTGEVSRIVAAPSNGSTLLSGTNSGIYRSVDGGATWTAVTGSPTGRVFRMAIALSTPSVAYASAACGVYKTSDSGASWSAVSSTGLPGVPSRGVASIYVYLFIDPLTPARFIPHHRVAGHRRLQPGRRYREPILQRHDGQQPCRGIPPEGGALPSAEFRLRAKNSPLR